ncbi:hypothetical protein VitviT2T_005585 [Vitis vinifera]|uniref:Uncharacterized protein n=1 Tax=Vitis vinifera TaxID=29760 RepID=A0ABY9BTE7_VITVI|nr:hypothetical protein VitviT2T_005585 [Vitis vinifera]
MPGFKWSEPIRPNPSERNRNKRCDYHKDHGHTTEMCRSLHYMVEDLLKAGHLKQYVRTTPKGEGSSHGRDPRTPMAPVRAVINYIHGGPLDDEYSSKRKRQRLLRAATVREQPHRDALILTLGVGDYDVRRILVDPGSSADLLQVAVIKQMGFIPSSLENPGRTLSRFNAASRCSHPNIRGGRLIREKNPGRPRQLRGPVAGGGHQTNGFHTLQPRESRKNPVRIQRFFHNLTWGCNTVGSSRTSHPKFLFFVVEDLSLFNAILGRTWLHGMKAIPSTYHQMVSFITQDGQIDLYGSQLTARQCYQIAREAGPSADREHSPKEANASDQ